MTKAGGPEQRQRILIVDDDPEWLEIIGMTVEEMGYEPVCAQSAEEGLALLEEESFRIILLDWRLPTMSAQEFLRLMPDSSARVVLVTSARADEVGAGLAGGPRYYLPKGVERDTLSLMLTSLDAHG